jgi:hypothetical protein
VQYSPEICPAALIRPLVDTNLAPPFPITEKKVEAYVTAARGLGAAAQQTNSPAHTAVPMVALYESGTFVISHCGSRDQVLETYWAFKHRFVAPSLPGATELNTRGGITELPLRPQGRSEIIHVDSSGPPGASAPSAAAGTSGVEDALKRAWHTANPGVAPAPALPAPALRV